MSIHVFMLEHTLLIASVFLFLRVLFSILLSLKSSLPDGFRGGFIRNIQEWLFAN